MEIAPFSPEQPRMREKHEVIEPDHLVVVYHQTSPEFIERIKTEGLKPNTDSQHFNRQASALIDQFRPAYLVDHGISRFNTYARLLNPKNPEVMPDPSTLMPNMVVAQVDAKRCYVGSYEFATSALVWAKGGDAEEAKPFAENYWQHMVSLEDFLKYYHENPESDENIFIPNADAPAGLPEIPDPEVLIPDQIPAENIRIAA